MRTFLVLACLVIGLSQGCTCQREGSKENGDGKPGSADTKMDHPPEGGAPMGDEDEGYEMAPQEQDQEMGMPEEGPIEEEEP